MVALFPSFAAWRAKRATFKTPRRIRLYDKLAQFAHDGIPIARGLHYLHRRLARDRDKRAKLFSSFVARIDEGEHLSVVWARHISVGERLLIQAGEDSGKIDEGLAAACHLAEIMRRLRTALAAELVYPVVLLGFLCVILAVAAFQLVPVLLGAVPLEKWPSYSRGLYYLSNFVLHFGVIVLVAVAVLTVIALRSLPRWRGPVREFLDRWCPPWSIYREVTGSSFIIALAALVSPSAGMTARIAVERLMLSSSPWLRAHLQRMMQQLLVGTSPGLAMRTGLFVREVEDDIEDYSNHSNFDVVLKRIGVDQVDGTIRRIVARAAVLRVLFLVLALGSMLYIWTASVMVGISVGQAGMATMH